jgi:hypothetical protein
MKKRIAMLDAFVLSGFVAGFFSGFINPLYVSLILSKLDGRIIALGSLMSSAFPVLVGALLGNRRVFGRLYAALPVIMLVELVAASASALVAALDLRAYYLTSMFVLGVFSSSVVYLLQRLKEIRYRGHRAAFDRRCDMADAFGLLSGSIASMASFSFLQGALAVAVLGSAQTAVVYGLFIFLYRKMPSRRKRRGDAEQEPHPRPRRRAPFAARMAA